MAEWSDFEKVDGQEGGGDWSQFEPATADDIAPGAILAQTLTQIRGASEEQRQASGLKTLERGLYVGSRLPGIVGLAAKTVLPAQALNAVSKIKSGDAAANDYKTAALFLHLQEREQARVKKGGIGGRIFDTVTALPGFMADFALSGGVYAGAKGAIQQGATKLVGKAAATTAGRAAGLAAATAASPQFVAPNVAERMMPEMTQRQGPAGDLANIDIGDGKSFIEALPPAYLDAMIELGSERAGGHLVKGAGAVLSKLPGAAKVQALKQAITSRWLSNPGRTPQMLQEALKQGGWNGVAGEVLEERVGDIARLATGLESPEQNVTGQLASSLAADPEKAAKLRGEAAKQLLVEGVSFLAPGAVHVASQALPTTKADVAQFTTPENVNAVLQASRQSGTEEHLRNLAAASKPSRTLWENAGLPEAYGRTAEARQAFAGHLKTILDSEAEASSGGLPSVQSELADRGDVIQSQFQEAQRGAAGTLSRQEQIAQAAAERRLAEQRAASTPPPQRPYEPQPVTQSQRELDATALDQFVRQRNAEAEHVQPPLSPVSRQLPISPDYEGEMPSLLEPSGITPSQTGPELAFHQQPESPPLRADVNQVPDVNAIQIRMDVLRHELGGLSVPELNQVASRYGIRKGANKGRMIDSIIAEETARATNPPPPNPGPAPLIGQQQPTATRPTAYQSIPNPISEVYGPVTRQELESLPAPDLSRVARGHGIKINGSKKKTIDQILAKEQAASGQPEALPQPEATPPVQAADQPVEAPAETKAPTQRRYQAWTTGKLAKRDSELETWLGENDPTHPQYDSRNIEQQLVRREIQRRKETGSASNVRSNQGSLGQEDSAQAGQESRSANLQLEAPRQASGAVRSGAASGEEVAPTSLTISPQAVGIVAASPVNSVLGDIGESIAKTAKRWMTSAGMMPDAAYTLDRQRKAQIATSDKALRFGVTKLRDALLKTQGSVTLSPSGVETMNRAMRSDPAALASLPEPVRNSVLELRRQMDAASRKLIDIGVAQGDLEIVFDENMGTYWNRSYQVYDDPKWRDKVKAMPDVWNKAHALLQIQNPSADPRQIDNLLNDMLEPETVKEYVAGRRIGSKDLTIIKPRKEVPPELRALWGEYKDPFVQITKSLVKASRLAANHEFLTKVREAGLGKFFFEKDDPNRAGSHVLIAPEGSKAMEPLSGLYSTPEIKEAFDQALLPQKGGDDLPSIMFRLYMKGIVSTRIAKTVGNFPTGWFRNFLSNPLLVIRDGHFGWMADWMRGKGLPEAGRATLEDVRTEAPEFLRRLFPTDEAWKQRVLRYYALGLSEQSVASEDLRHSVTEAINQPTAEVTANPTYQLATKGLGALSAGYQAMDTPWRWMKFELELARRKKAYESAGAPWDQAAQEQEAADITNRTFTSYDLIPAAMKALRRIPVAGTFTSFSSEVIRSQYHSLKQAAKELNDPILKGIGAQRLIGNLVALSVPAAIAAAARMVTGMLWDDDRDYRNFIAPWSQNSDLVWLYKGDDGHSPAYIDLSYTTPNSIFLKPIYALMRGDNWEESFWGAAKEAFGPFVGPDILTTKIGDVLWNKTRTPGGSREVYNEQDTTGKILTDSAAHVWEALEPGSVTAARRFRKAREGFIEKTGRKYDPATEAISALGFRAVPVDIQQSLSFATRHYVENNQKATAIFSTVYGSRGTIQPGETAEAYQRAEQAKRRLFDDLHSKATAAVRLGVPEKDVQAVLDTNGLSPKDVDVVMRGEYTPYSPSESMAERSTPERTKEFLKAQEQSATPEMKSRLSEDELHGHLKSLTASRPQTVPKKQRDRGVTYKAHLDSFNSEISKAKAFIQQHGITRGEALKHFDSITKDLEPATRARQRGILLSRLSAK